MLTTHKWRERADLNMEKAQRTSNMAVSQCDKSRRVHDETVNDNHEMYGDLKSSLEQKVLDSRQLVATLDERAQSLESSVQSTHQSLAELESALRAKDPPLQLCTWRLDQRTQRPAREQVRDVAEVALEEERSALVALKWELSDAAERARAAIAELRRKLAAVRQDMQHKEHALGIDEMCFSTTQSSFLSMSLRTPRPAVGTVPSVRTPDRSARLESHNNEQMRQRKTGSLERSAADREDFARALRAESAELVARTSARASEARAKSDRAIQERISEIDQTVSSLEQEIQETDARIDVTNGTVSETRFHLNALEQPMAMASACNEWRKGRSAPEHIADPVAASLQDHHGTLLRAHDSLSEQHGAEKAGLEDLWARRQHLLEDLEDKTAARQIDSRCLARGQAHGAGDPVRAAERFGNPMPLPIHGDPVPGTRRALNGFAAPLQSSGSLTPGRGGTQARAASGGRPGTVAPGYLSSWSLARKGPGTAMTPRSFSASGSRTAMPMTARAAMTY
mmetsp:Transcript_43321/g.134763  ORF Transcript_43321/g.134763 Transcript_43321/m.134763 type:complete len:511 (+) Transcript_43321:101-1633(+)